MKRYYSKTTQTTYLTGIHPEMPDDAVEITDARYLEVIVNPAEGKVRSHDSKGLPILVGAPEPTGEMIAEAERQWRDAAIGQIQWLINRHRDELELDLPTTLKAEQFTELLGYVQRLRDWPAAPDFPDYQRRPEPPLWIVDLIK